MSINENVSLFIDHPEWGDEVVRNQDQTVKHPLEINASMAWILGAICFFGFPLNFEIIIRILYDKTMRLKPRYIIQLGVAFSDLFILLAVVVVVVHFAIGPNEILCHIFVSFFMAIAYNCFFLNNFLSLLDCFMAISFPLWHLAKVTPQRIVYGLIGLNLAMALAMEWPFISGVLEVRCALQFNQGLYANGTSSILFVLCFIFYCVDFFITWLHIHRWESLRVITGAYSAAAEPTATTVIIQEMDERRQLETIVMQDFNTLSTAVRLPAAAVDSSVVQHQVSGR
jgi:hypothetical protein